MRCSEVATKARISNHMLKRPAKRVTIERDAGTVSVKAFDIVLQFGSLSALT
jgi:hypothetical protein